MIPDRWAIVRLRFTGPYARLELRDQSDTRVATESAWAGGPVAIPVNADPLTEHLVRLAHDLPAAREGVFPPVPVPLAVFLDVPRVLWSQAPLLTNLSMLLLGGGRISQDRVQFVLFAGSRTRVRSTFTLPFAVLAAGSTAAAAIAGIKNMTWMNEPAVRDLGFAIATETAPDADAAPALQQALRELNRDILIATDASTALAVIAQLPVDIRPRLVIGLGPVAAMTPPPRGVALVLLDAPGIDPRVIEILMGLVHDLPIHEAVAAASRKLPGMVGIAADPWTNQSLRLRDAAIDVLSQMERLQIRLPSAAVEPYIRRVGKSRPDLTVSWSGVVPPHRPPLRLQPSHFESQAADDEAVTGVDNSYNRSYDVMRAAGRRARMTRALLPGRFEDFKHETSGVVPLAETRQQLHNLHQWIAEQTTLTHSLTADDSAFRDLLAVDQQRVIDVALQRVDTTPLLAAVDARTTLAARATYRLRVHAGNQEPESLVSGPHPPIDPLLPPKDNEGHLLDVVVQAKNFTLVTAAVQQLRLPPFGASDPVYFTIKTPEALDRASLRLHVYYQNHLIQSFLLEADVTTAEQTAQPESPTGVHLVYSRVDRLVLDQVQPRAFSLAANENGSTTHGLLLKGTGTSGEVTLDKETFKPYVNRFRGLLDSATRDPLDPSQPRIYPAIDASAAVPPNVAALIRELAQNGRQLYVALFTKASREAKMRAQFVDLQDQRDKKIQVVRFDETFVFPWSMLYDFLPPDDWLTAPVCLGVTSDNAGPCAHGPESGVVCVNGFWGVRHFVEELIGRGSDTDASVSAPAKGAVRVIVDDTVDGAAALKTALKGVMDQTQYIDGPSSEKSILDLLWKTPSERPSILVVLGHMEGTGAATAASTSRIELIPAQEWLTRAAIEDRATRARDSWDQPRPIIALMACESATTTADTVNDFVSVLTLAGASAVVGTEAIVTGPFASQCAQKLVGALWTAPRKTLGEAMTTLRRDLLAQGNPLGFVLHAVGNVDLSIR